MWIVYEILFVIGLILYLPRALWRRRLPHRGWRMRLGRYPDPVVQSLQGKRALWVHAVSVGEVLAAQPLLRALTVAQPDDPLVLSVITPGGFEVASKAVAGRGIPVYFPLDLRPCVARALNAIRPRILILMESELWPTVIRQAHARGIPIAVVNGRLSPRAFRRYRLVRRWLGWIFTRVDCFVMQSQADADRLLQLGAPPGKVRVAGSLKWEASVRSRSSPQAMQEMARQLGLNGGQVVVVAGSTHRGEEAAVLEAFRAIRSTRADARLIIAPRHLERLAEVEGLARQAGFIPARLSQAAVGGEWQVGLVDTFGRLSFYYGLATVVFIGGSLIPHGGQNPLEAAGLGRPIVFGPSMHNFAAIVQDLLAHRAARQLRSPAELTAAFQDLLTHPGDAQAMGRRAHELTERSQGAAQRTLEALRPLLGSSFSSRL